jgi:hypothetical protein
MYYCEFWEKVICLRDSKGEIYDFYKGDNYTVNYIRNEEGKILHYNIYSVSKENKFLFIDTIYSEGDFIEYFITLASFREKRINSILND